MDNALGLHRPHFAFTVTYHYLIPQLTMGLALLIFLMKTALVTIASFSVRPALTAKFTAIPWGGVFPLIALAALWFVHSRKSFVASCAYLAGMLASVVFSVYPEVLPASPGAEPLTIYNTSASAYGLQVGLVWWIPGLLLAVGYAVFLYRRFAGKPDRSSAT